MKGKAIVLGDNIGGDMIISSGHLAGGADSAPIQQYLFESCRPDFPDIYVPGDFIVAGENFGCGSSREQVMIALKEAQIRCVLAKSFSRQFYRSGINMGILPILCSAKIRDGDLLELNLEQHRLTINGRTEYRFPTFPPQLLGFLQEGGLLNYYRRYHSLR